MKVNTHIQIDDFGQQRANDKHQQHIGEPLVELRLAIDLSNDGTSQTLGSNDTQPSDQRANGNVNHHALLPPPWCHVPCDSHASENDDSGKGEEARGNDIVLHVLDIAHRTLLGSIQGNDHTANDTQEAAHPSHEAQPFLQDPPTEDGRDHDGESTQRRDEDGIDEHVGRKVANLTHNHQSHPKPPPEILQVSIPFARLFIVFLVGLEQTNLLDHEGYTNEQSTSDRETDSDDFVGSGPRVLCCCRAGGGGCGRGGAGRCRGGGCGIFRRLSGHEQSRVVDEVPGGVHGEGGGEKEYGIG